MGPGTHIESRIRKGDVPVSIPDFASLIHDIEYLKEGMSQYKADDNMRDNIIKADPLWTGFANVVRAAFILKDLSRLMKGSPVDNAKYYRLKKMAKDKGLIHKDMDFADDL
jgi:hypothetical protein